MNAQKRTPDERIVDLVDEFSDPPTIGQVMNKAEPESDTELSIGNANLIMNV